jgi:hypothetical protein
MVDDSDAGPPAPEGWPDFWRKTSDSTHEYLRASWREEAFGFVAGVIGLPLILAAQGAFVEAVIPIVVTPLAILAGHCE